MISTLTLRKPSESPDIARLLLHGYPEHRVFAMHGELGAGKTTLIKAFCTVLGVGDQTSSPSFSIVNEYRSAAGDPVYHLDLYRLREARELHDIGVEEYLDSGHYCFIEWPELAEGLLPPGVLHVTMEAAVNGVRTLRMVPAVG